MQRRAEKSEDAMWQLFTDRARQAVYFAAAEAARLGENYIGTETLLLGLIRDTDNVAVRILGRLHVSPDDLRADIERQVSRRHGQPGQEPQITPRAKRVLDLAYEEAQLMQHSVVGTGHILLGLIREGDGLGGHVLKKRRVELERVRKEVAEGQDEEKQPQPGDDLQRLNASLSGDRGENKARLTGALFVANRGGEPWWQVRVALPFQAEALLAEVRAEGFPEAAIADENLIWVRPVRQDECD
jgi:ATP-dependent Clp protease ATP-binding subunit ClpA